MVRAVVDVQIQVGDLISRMKLLCAVLCGGAAPFVVRAARRPLSLNPALVGGNKKPMWTLKF